MKMAIKINALMTCINEISSTQEYLDVLLLMSISLTFVSLISVSPLTLFKHTFLCEYNITYFTASVNLSLINLNGVKAVL